MKINVAAFVRLQVPKYDKLNDKRRGFCSSWTMTFLINMSIETGLVPSDWKIAKVIPVFKSGKKSDLDNYRPISDLPILSKLLEKFVHKQLIDHLEKNCMLFSIQFGFRSKRSTELAVTFLTDHIRKEADKGSLTGAIFIDLSKAFDMVGHSSLLNKFPGHIPKHDCS